MTNKSVNEHLKNNAEWVQEKLAQDPNYFTDIAQKQTPKYMWIGCADSRLSAEHILKAEPGEFFVQRNIANLVCHTDLNTITALAFAIEVLKVENIIVCGHSNCGGCEAGFVNHNGLVDNWLQHIRDVIRLHEAKLMAISDKKERSTLLSELNVQHQILNLGNTTVVRQAWESGHAVSLHPWFYDLEKGTIRPLQDSIENQEQLSALQQKLFRQN